MNAWITHWAVWEARTVNNNKVFKFCGHVCITVYVVKEILAQTALIVCQFWTSLKLIPKSTIHTTVFNYTAAESYNFKKIRVFKTIIFCSKYLQGISYWNVFYKLTLTDKNMQARICLKVILSSWDYGFLVSSTSFCKKLHILASTASDRNCIRY